MMNMKLGLMTLCVRCRCVVLLIGGPVLTPNPTFITLPLLPKKVSLCLRLVLSELQQFLTLTTGTWL